MQCNCNLPSKCKQSHFSAGQNKFYEHSEVQMLNMYFGKAEKADKYIAILAKHACHQLGKMSENTILYQHHPDTRKIFKICF